MYGDKAIVVGCYLVHMISWLHDAVLLRTLGVHQSMQQLQQEATARAGAEAQAAASATAAATAHQQLQQQQQLLQQQLQKNSTATAPAAEATAAPQQAPEWWLAFQQEEARVAATSPSWADLPPTYPAPATDCLQTLHTAWLVLQHDRLLTFTEVGLATAQCAELLGTAWDKMYGQHPVPAVIPRVVASLLFRALHQLAALFAERPEEERGLAAEAAKVVMESPDAKRVRISPH